MNKKRKLLSLLIVFALILSTIFAIDTSTVQAASKKQAALNAYKTFLQKDKKEYDSRYYYKSRLYEFCVKDINNDGVPELFIDYNITGNMENIYCYKSGKIKHIFGIAHGGIGWVNPRKGIVNYADNFEDNSYLKVFPNGKYSTIAKEMYSGQCYVNGKTVTKSVYKKKTKQFGNKKIKLKYHTYTTANLSKYLK